MYGAYHCIQTYNKDGSRDLHISSKPSFDLEMDREFFEQLKDYANVFEAEDGSIRYIEVLDTSLACLVDDYRIPSVIAENIHKLLDWCIENDEEWIEFFVYM